MKNEAFKDVDVRSTSILPGPGVFERIPLSTFPDDEAGGRFGTVRYPADETGDFTDWVCLGTSGSFAKGNFRVTLD